MKIKKLISVLTALVIVTMSLSTIGVSAKTTTDNTTLKWDFESTNDIAPIDFSKNWWNANDTDSIGSGAWSRQSAGVQPANNGPYHVPFTKIFTKNQDQDSNVGPWPYIEPTATSTAFSTQTLENGGSYCVGINSGTGAAGRAVAMCIMLNDTEFIPGHTYKISADLFSGSSDRAVYVGLSKPSERPTATNTENITNPSWLMNSDNRANLSTAYDPVSPKENGCADNTMWRKGVGYITPTADLYENGKILLYIGGADVGENHPKLPKNEFLYIDNIEMVPQNASAGYSTLRKGRIWDFEEGASQPSFTTLVGAYDNAGKAIDSVNQWGPIAREWSSASAQSPRYIKVSEANARMYGRWTGSDLPLADFSSKGYAGTPAANSSECIYVKSRATANGWEDGTDNKVHSLGISVVLSQDEFPAGTYKLGFYGASTRACVAAAKPFCSDTWRVAVLPTQYPGLWNTYGNGETESLANATMKVDTGIKNGSFWSYYTTDVTLTDASFTNGTTRLILYINIGSNNMYGGEALFFDDITLTPVDSSLTVPADGSAVNGYMTTVISNKATAPTAYIAEYAKNNGDVILTDVNSFKPAAGVANHHFSIVPDAALGSPFIKTFLFDTNLKPLTRAETIGEE